MAWTQTHLDAADAAILQALQGKTVSFNGRSWTSQDLAELRALRAEIAQALGVAAGTARAFRVAGYSKDV